MCLYQIDMCVLSLYTYSSFMILCTFIASIGILKNHFLTIFSGYVKIVTSEKVF
jgi:hypothetical protein